MDKTDEYSVGQQVRYKSNPFDLSVPMGDRVVQVEKIMPFRSRTTGNQCVVVSGDAIVRDAAELAPVV